MTAKIQLKEVTPNLRYESEDKTIVLQRCQYNNRVWRLWENGIQIDAGQYRNDLADEYNYELVDIK